MSETEKTIRVKLLKPHTHAGVEFDPDNEIEVTEADSQWLIAQKVAEAIAAPKSTPSAKTTPIPEEK